MHMRILLGLLVAACGAAYAADAPAGYRKVADIPFAEVDGNRLALDLYLPEVAKLASPVYHLDANDPPMLLLHGDQDPQMPINQSLQLYGAYREKGLDAEFLPVYQAAHGGKKFHEGAQLKAATEFLKKKLRP